MLINSCFVCFVFFLGGGPVFLQWATSSNQTHIFSLSLVINNYIAFYKDVGDEPTSSVAKNKILLLLVLPSLIQQTLRDSISYFSFYIQFYNNHKLAEHKNYRKYRFVPFAQLTFKQTLANILGGSIKK